MPVHYLPIVKGLGILSAGSLGLCLANDAYRTIPSLVSSLLYRNPGAVARATTFAERATAIVLSLGPLAALLLGTAYLTAGPASQHPYLIYCAVGSIASLTWYCYGNWFTIRGLITSSRDSFASFLSRFVLPLVGKSNLTPEVVQGVTPVALPPLEDDYVNISHNATTNTSDLSTLTPESSSNVSPKLGLVQEEAADALNRKECALRLDQMRDACILSSSIAFLTTAIGVVGLIGERC